MTGSAKRKGDRGEREAKALIHDLLGVRVDRRFGAGQREDSGDLVGVTNWALQVAWWDDVARAIRDKPREVEGQRLVSGEPFAASFIRSPRGVWRVYQTPEQWAAVVRETWPGCIDSSVASVLHLAHDADVG